MSLEGTNDKQRDTLARGMNALLTSPDAEVQRATKRMLKKIDPTLNFPELAIEEEVTARLAPVIEDNKKLRDEAKERQWRTEVEAEHARVRAAGYDVDTVQKLMKDRGIVNFDTAMDLLSMQNQLATPTPAELSGSYNLPEDQKDIFKNPAKWARDKAHAIIDEMKRKPQRA